MSIVTCYFRSLQFTKSMFDDVNHTTKQVFVATYCSCEHLARWKLYGNEFMCHIIIITAVEAKGNMRKNLFNLVFSFFYKNQMLPTHQGLDS